LTVAGPRVEGHQPHIRGDDYAEEGVIRGRRLGPFDSVHPTEPPRRGHGKSGVYQSLPPPNQQQPAQELLENHKVADVDDSHPILLAAQRGWSDVVSSLVNQGADLNVASEMGETPLMRAIKAGDKIEPSVIGNMLKHGSAQTINSRTTTKHFFPEYSALHFACDSSLNRNSQVVAMLVQAGADPSIKNTNGETPLDLAKQYPQHLEAIKNPSKAVITLRKTLSAPDMSPASHARRVMQEGGNPPALDLDDQHHGGGERKASVLEFATHLLGGGAGGKPPLDPTNKKKSG
jgi:hypothetical protein